MSQETDLPKIYCYNHSDRETMLRCNRCDRPICTSCAILTPTGYRCKECVRGQQKVFETAQWIDYPLALVVAGVLSFIGSVIAQFLGFFTFFIAPIAGVAIAEAVRWVIRKRRAKLLYQVAAGGALLGALPFILIGLIGGLLSGSGLYALTGIIWPSVYAFLVVSTTYYRLGGIQIR